MEIISHRGYWTNALEKNTRQAFVRSFENGWGVETDLRDLNGSIVIAHDMPCQGHDGSDAPMSFAEFLGLYRDYGSPGSLALNIKADGLQASVQHLLAKAGVSSYFVFDMSIPDTLGYRRLQMPYYSRQSEYETQVALYADARGVWMDCFEGDWIEPGHIKQHLDQNKLVCLVSPELHRRPQLVFWERLKEGLDLSATGDRLQLCTDFPEDARQFFGGQ